MAHPHVKPRQQLREERDAAVSRGYKLQREIDVLKKENQEMQNELRDLRAKLRTV